MHFTTPSSDWLITTAHCSSSCSARHIFEQLLLLIIATISAPKNVQLGREFELSS